MPVDKNEFRHGLGSFASAVTVVTLQKPDGSRAGITVTAFTSVSLEPPLILVCIAKKARLHDSFLKGETFAVNYLAAEQAHVSQRFASSAGDPFAEISAEPSPGGAPWIEGALGCLECKIVDLVVQGDHTIVVGQVEATRINEGAPLLYFRGKYASLAPEI